MEEKQYITYLESPVGWLELNSNSEALTNIHFKIGRGQASEKIPDILIESKKQLSEYFQGKRKTFDLQLQQQGTEFQQKIWKLVLDIPFGKTASYLNIALRSGSEKNTRAVGLANGKNPIPIIIPCHRIIGADGKLTGYAGGLERKRWLLQHELNYSNKQHLLF